MNNEETKAILDTNKELCAKMDKYYQKLESAFMGELQRVGVTEFVIQKIAADLQKLGRHHDKLLGYVTAWYPMLLENVQRIGSNTKLPTTSYYPTTSNYRLQSWGIYDPSRQLYVEQLTANLFIYNYRGIKGITEKKISQDKQSKRIIEFLNIEDQELKFTKPVQVASYNRPSSELAYQYIDGKYKPRGLDYIIQDIEKILLALYDFKFPTDISIIKLAIGQSYLIPLFEGVFYLGIDATKGGGKTTLLELACFLMRHGIMGGDISAAALPRMVDQLQLSIAVDEIDQKIGEKAQEDITAVLRKGQRRGNPYTRCEGRSHIPTSYDVFGSHLYSFRSDVEDAFGSRTIPIHAAKSRDSRLSVLNLYKAQVLKPLADELFLWAIDNLLKIPVVSCSNVVGCSGTLRDKDSELIRDQLFKKFTEHLGDDHVKLVKKLSGRNAELAYICCDVANRLNLDVLSDLNNVMTLKETDEIANQDFYLESLERFLGEKHMTLSSIDKKEKFTKKDGKYAACLFYPKNLLYQEFVQSLTQNNVRTIGHKKFNSLLRDLGFIERDTLRNVRVDDMPRQCIIFSDKILNRIGVEKEEQILSENIQ
ncbi:MAG: hypothetical protein ABH879_03550 [archaeon]